MTSPLRGIRVLELSQFIAGPFAGLMLADLGAEVVKIERPDGGDPFRGFGAGGADRSRFAGYSHNFSAFNRNKRSLTIDLATDPGRELLRDLVAHADVLLENYRPGVLDRMGLDGETLRRLNPALVYCSISGFSADGPYRDRPAYDTVGQAFSGILGTLLDPDKPRMRGPTIADQVTGMQAAYGVLAALVERGRTGVGGRVEISMLDACLYHMPDSFTALTQTGLELTSETRAAFSLAFSFRCGDGGLLAVQVSSTEKFWRALLIALERPDIGEDARFVDRPSRIRHFPALVEALQPVFAANPRGHWLDVLIAADVPCAPVNGIAEAMADPEIVHAGLFHEIEHPRRGTLTMMHRAVRIEGEREDAPLPPPDLGEHNETVLRSCGIAPERIAALREQGII